MKHINYRDIPIEKAKEKGAKDVRIRWLITDKDGAKNFAMRYFEINPGGYTPWHQHDWEHEVFVLEGDGIAIAKDGEAKFGTGDVFFIPPMEWHQFKNTGRETVTFLCLIPYKGARK